MMESRSEPSVEFEPEPDYSESDDDGVDDGGDKNDDDGVTKSSADDVIHRETSKDETEANHQTLAKDDYDKIVAATGMLLSSVCVCDQFIL